MRGAAKAGPGQDVPSSPLSPPCLGPLAHHSLLIIHCRSVPAPTILESKQEIIRLLQKDKLDFPLLTLFLSIQNCFVAELVNHSSVDT